jgi:hypothetical protein
VTRQILGLALTRQRWIVLVCRTLDSIEAAAHIRVRGDLDMHLAGLQRAYSCKASDKPRW